MNKIWKVVLVLVFVIASFLVFAYLVDNFIFPSLPESLQNHLVWTVSTLILGVAFLASLAQIMGLSVGDLFSQDKQQKNGDMKIDGGIGNTILQVRDQANINIFGDVLQNIPQVRDRNIKDAPKVKNSIDINKLSSEIQTKLFKDNNQLSYVLTLCLDLCRELELPSDYNEWIIKELTGYDNTDDFKKGFENEDAYEDWLNKWGRHRLIDTHLKIGYRSSDTGRYNIEELPYNKIFIAQSVDQIVKDLEMKLMGRNELSIELYKLGEDYFDEAKELVKVFPVQVNVPRDLRVFFNIGAYESLLSGIRKIVLEILQEAHNQQ
jgi:hypothetical protein